MATTELEPFGFSFSYEHSQDEPKLRADIAKEIQDILKESDADPSGVEVSDGGVGYGADTIVLYAILPALAAIFMAGKSIEENLDAWIRLGRRFRKALSKWRGDGALRISESVAMAVVLSKLHDEFGASGLSVVARHVFPVRNLSLQPNISTDFVTQPDRYYVFVCTTPASDGYVVGMKSNGVVDLCHRIPTDDWMEYFGVEHRAK